ncbi:MAG TPA: dTMP kinase [Gammaproteobacteria bacterium]|jgi:dTMP kinase|nr:dTMP kinase [Gammaproteobacteria bacterium]
MENKKNGVFFTIEGIEGVGKSTALYFIANFLKEKNKEVLLTREPGGTLVAENIRQILLTPTPEKILPETELLLMFASRIQHIAHVIQPALQSGKWVVSDRFTDASFAYQGGGRKIDKVYIEMLEKWLVQDLRPDITILLDASPEIGLQRAKHRGPHDRIEMEKLEFFERVRAAYLARAEKDPARFRIINAAQPLANVQADIQKILETL